MTTPFDHQPNQPAHETTPSPEDAATIHALGHQAANQASIEVDRDKIARDKYQAWCETDEVHMRAYNRFCDDRLEEGYSWPTIMKMWDSPDAQAYYLGLTSNEPR